jgi:hypothetical protein
MSGTFYIVGVLTGGGMADKSRVRIYESDKRELHERKNYGETYADVVERLLEDEAEDDDEVAQPAD